MKRSPLRRGKGLKRGAPLRRTRMRRHNPARSAQRRADAFGPQAELCRVSPCIVCQASPCDPHHVRSRGAGGTDSDCVPLCRAHHDEGHRVGWQTFAVRHGVDLAAEAERMAERARSDQWGPA